MVEKKTPILELLQISKTFQRRGHPPKKAINNVSLSVYPGETVALVGESGSGKSSVARAALSLLRPDEGEILLEGQPILGLTPEAMRNKRKIVQPVFQDSAAAFNPRRTIGQLIQQGLNAAATRPADYDARTVELLNMVQLSPGEDFASRYPHELSGGQRQRAAIARAIAPEPKLIIADEPLSGADVTIRGQVLNLMLDLQARTGLAYLFITHDIAVARSFASRVLVMYLGEIVEQGDPQQVIENPAHPYTQRLVASALRYA